MADFLSMLLGGLPSILSNFRGDASPYTKQQEQLSARMAQYGDAIANPSNPLYQNTYKQYQDQNRTNLAEVIAESQRQNRSQSALGRKPLFSAERGSENIFRNLMQQYGDLGVRSDQQTKSALQAASGETGKAFTAYTAASPFKAVQNLQQNQLGYEGIGNLLNQMRGPSYLTDGAPMQQGNVQWNTPRVNPDNSFFRGYY